MLKLLTTTPSSLTQAEMYGRLFMQLADHVDYAREEAMMLYREAIEAGIDPADMEANYSLLTLDLAEEDNVNSIAGGDPKFVYFEPDPVCTITKKER